jgi:hypothetical protein
MVRAEGGTFDLFVTAVLTCIWSPLHRERRRRRPQGSYTGDVSASSGTPGRCGPPSYAPGRASIGCGSPSWFHILSLSSRQRSAPHRDRHGQGEYSDLLTSLDRWQARVDASQLTRGA